MINHMAGEIKKIGWGFGGCNMNCRHCYSASGQRTAHRDFKTLKTIADKICSQDITDINFGTGEFLLNPNALKTAKYIKKRYPRVQLGLTTNGYSAVHMNRRVLKNLFHDIDVSIDFPEKEKHNAFRRHERAWDWATSSLEICGKLGIERSIVTCVSSETSDRDILGLLALAKKYGASLRINWFRPAGRGEKKLCISAARFWEVIRLLATNAVFEGLSDPLLEAVILEKKESGHCSCGWTSARIQADLTVTPCVFLKGGRWGSGHITGGVLDAIYRHENFEAVRSRRPPRCLACGYFRACRGGCASRAYLQAGSLEEADAYCPLGNPALKAIINEIKKNIIIKESDKVHNGYLCTLIVSPE